MKVSRLFGWLYHALNHPQAWIVPTAAFAIIYAALSLVGHYNFHTNAYDLGIFNQGLYHYAHGELGPNTLRHVATLLGDHFELAPLLVAPLYYLFGTYTLLLVQITAILAGGYGVYRLVSRETGSRVVAITALLIFYLFFGVYSALSFDYHNNVLGAMLLPWLLLTLRQQQFRAYYVLLGAFLLCKENLALISLFLGLGTAVFEKRGLRKHGLITAMASLAYFGVVLGLVIPAFNNGQYDHWIYTALGSGPLEAVQNLILHPISSAALWFDHPDKLQYLALLGISGGFLAARRPVYALLFVPLLAQKFFADDPQLWGYRFHYSIEFAPLVAAGAAITASRFRPRFRTVALVSLIVVNLGILANLKLTDGSRLTKLATPSWYAGPAAHRPVIKQALAMVPADAAVSTQNVVVPHLTKRDQIYLYPEVSDARFIVLDETLSYTEPGSLERTSFAAHISQLTANPAYQHVFERDGMHIFEKR